MGRKEGRKSAGVAVRLRAGQRAWLRRVARAAGVTLSDVVRRLVDEEGRAGVCAGRGRGGRGKG